MGYLLYIVFGLIAVVYIVKIIRKKEMPKGSNYTPFDDIMLGRTQSTQPIQKVTENTEDTKHTPKYGEELRLKKSGKENR
ncbi:hypothetical protein [Aneurinibacillus tyrosinisolvens]|uniref:hypothetical protein n=1 Tax=Aneurinibacillus tyrosinisolvens TaxID=1443435 RepID=UPI00063F7250|nr:hypothetical protein [Aneurinibacillus tyrosinisolvens]